MNTMHPELIGQYMPRPEPGYFLCLACDADARKRGHKDGSVSYVFDRDGHTRWHNRHTRQRR